MLITVSLGNQIAEFTDHPPVELRCLATASMAELPPDVFFDALQRIGHPTDWDADHLRYDLERIGEKNEGVLGTALRVLRREMEARQAPSMSVGDTITFWSNPNDETGERTQVITHTCERIGWTTTVPAPAV